MCLMLSEVILQPSFCRLILEDCYSGCTWVGYMESDVVLKNEVLYSLLLFLFLHQNSTSSVAFAQCCRCRGCLCLELMACEK